jgi:hypothetical protein
MKKFILNIFIFCLPLIFASLFIDRFLSVNLKKSDSYAWGEFSVWNDIYDGKINSQIVIYGSSNALVEVNPQMINDSFKVNTYNLGIDGHNFWLQYFRHSLLLEHNNRPKLIIQVLGITTLVKRKDLYNPDQFLPYMFYHKEIKKATNSYIGFSNLDYEIPLLRYYGKKQAIIEAIKAFIKPGRSMVPGRVRGYQGMERQWNNDLETAKKNMASYETDFDSLSIALFERYLGECKANNIKMIFVYPPEYIEGQKFVKNRESIIKTYFDFSKKYDIPFLDYSHDTLSTQKEYFYNSTHLNKSGAELFTNKLIKDLRKYQNSPGL